MMRLMVFPVASADLFFVPLMRAQDGQYKILKMARVGRENGLDYIYADSAARRLYIPRRARETKGRYGYDV